MHWFIALFGLLAGLALAVEGEAEAPAAKTDPSSSRYPKAADWEALSDAIGGRVYKCPLSGKIADFCGAPSLMSDYVLFAESAAEVAEGLKFATEHNLRVTIRNTGHDFMARHSGRGAFTIILNSMKGTKFMRTFTPSAGSAEFKRKHAALNQTAVAVNAGALFYEVLQALVPRNQAVAHGSDGSVGAAGGWIQGGGHGPWSNLYGLGCDNVLELEVALTNGTIVTTNEESFPDLFWALRGGGGSTFGVVTKATMKTFPIPDLYPLALHVSEGNSGHEGFLDAVAYIFAMTPRFNDFGLSGYPVVSNSSYLSSLTAPGKTVEQIEDFIAPIVTKLKTFGVDVHAGMGPKEWGYWAPMFGLWIGHTRVPDILGDMHKEQKKWTELVKRSNTHGLGRRQYVEMPEVHLEPTYAMASRLLARDKLNEANLPAIRKMLGELKGYLLPYPNGGGAVSKNRNMDMGLNPAWRDAAMHLIAVNYDRPHNTKAMIPLSADNGAYINEGFEFEEDWKRTFFGPKKHYDRLLAVKKKYDPTNTLWCFPCVGGDVFYESKGKLYLAGV